MYPDQDYVRQNCYRVWTISNLLPLLHHLGGRCLLRNGLLRRRWWVFQLLQHRTRLCHRPFRSRQMQWHWKLYNGMSTLWKFCLPLLRRAVGLLQSVSFSRYWFWTLSVFEINGNKIVRGHFVWNSWRPINDFGILNVNFFNIVHARFLWLIDLSENISRMISQDAHT